MAKYDVVDSVGNIVAELSIGEDPIWGVILITISVFLAALVIGVMPLWLGWRIFVVEGWKNVSERTKIMWVGSTAMVTVALCFQIGLYLRCGAELLGWQIIC